jgi:peptidoglycan/LPS O-acetylase OafA/YrhL
VYHSGYLTGHDRLTAGSLAGVAVGGFFVISGFLLTWSLARNPSHKAFALKRLFRIRCTRW